MFRHRHDKRRWAARLLALWLLNVVVGIAHACIVTPGMVARGGPLTDAVTTGPADHPAGHAASHAGHAVGAHHHDGMHAGPAGDDGPMDQATCRAFCEKAALSIAPLKSALDDLQVQAPPLLAPMLVPPLALHLTLQPWVPRRDGVRSPPIPIAFLRLTR